jgi:hypothetical protein
MYARAQSSHRGEVKNLLFLTNSPEDSHGSSALALMKISLLIVSARTH